MFKTSKLTLAATVQEEIRLTIKHLGIPCQVLTVPHVELYGEYDRSSSN